MQSGRKKMPRVFRSMFRPFVGEISRTVFGFHLHLNVGLDLLHMLYRAAILAFGFMPKGNAEGVRIVLQWDFLPFQPIRKIGGRTGVTQPVSVIERVVAHSQVEIKQAGCPIQAAGQSSEDARLGCCDCP